jgi:hypothetical protein
VCEQHKHGSVGAGTGDRPGYPTNETPPARLVLGGQAAPFWVRASPWRKRQDSAPVSMMCARWVMRSTTAFARRASGNTLVHSPKGRLVVTIRLARSLRSEMTWKTSSAAPSGSARYPSSSHYADIGIA